MIRTKCNISNAENKIQAAGNVVAGKELLNNAGAGKYLQIQPKLTVGNSNAYSEHKTDTIADKVMRMPEQNFIQRKCAHYEEAEKAQHKPQVSFVQKKEASGNATVGDTISNQIQSTKSSGNAMHETTKSFMGNRFGADFSDVRIHSDSDASQLSNLLNAHAFTVDNDIYFNEGKYSSETSDGKYLLAHELTHVVQQKNTGTGKKIQRDEKGAADKTVSQPPAKDDNSQPVFSIELPQPLTLRVNGIGVSSPLVYIRGVNGNIIDIGPYTGSKSIDFPLAALEALGIPILSYLAFHGGSLSAYRGMRFSNIRALSGGTSFVRNALHYGYIQSDETDLYGAPGSYMPEEYAGIPNLRIHANPMDIGTMIDVRYYNDPLEDHPNNPAVMFSLSASFESNPIDALVNIAGAFGHMVQGDLYNLPGVTHNYPEYNR